MKSILLKIALIVTFFFFILLANLRAQEERKLQPFDEISVTGNIEVILEQGDEETAAVHAEGIPENKVSVFVKKNVLKLKLINSLFYKHEVVKIHVTYLQLRAIKGHAGARISSSSPIKTDKLFARATSGANVQLRIDVNALDAAVMEGAVLRLEGTSVMQEVKATTGGRYEGIELECDRTFVRAGTGGHAVVIAHKSLDASASTGGSIEYRGDPDQTNIKSVISGGIDKI